jgi:hypothetical protein
MLLLLLLRLLRLLLLLQAKCLPAWLRAFQMQQQPL